METILSALRSPRSLQVDVQSAYYVEFGVDKDVVQRFEHKVAQPTAASFGTADGVGQTIENLHLSTTYIAWVTRGLNITRVKTKAKAATNNPQTLHQIDEPASPTPVASNGDTLVWVTKVATSGELELFKSDPPHTAVTAGDPGSFSVASDRSMVMRGGDAFIAGDGITQYSLAGDTPVLFVRGGLPDHVVDTATHLYWTDGMVVSRAPFEVRTTPATVTTASDTVLGLAVHDTCVVLIDAAGHLAVVPTAGGEPELLVTLEGATSVASTADHILVTVVAGASEGYIVRIPWRAEQ